MAKSPSPFSFLWQALLLPSKNPKLFSNILLIYIIINALLYTGFKLSIAPLAEKLIELSKSIQTVDPNSPEFTELLNNFKAVTKQLLVFEIVYYILLFLTSCFMAIITYYANSATYLGEVLSLKELLNRVKGIIKGPVITQLVVVFLCFIYLFVFAIITFAITWYVSVNSKTTVWLYQIPLILLATLIMVYLATIWSMGVAISVIEPNVYGFGAITHATRLLKGKKKQVFLLVFTLIIASGIIYVINTIVMKFAIGSNAGNWILGFLSQLLNQMVTWYSMMAITVLYYECNQSNGGVEYAKLATTSIV